MIPPDPPSPPGTAPPVTKIPQRRTNSRKIVADTMVGGATLTKLIGTSAWYAPGAAGAALVESILRDEKKTFHLLA